MPTRSGGWFWAVAFKAQTSVASRQTVTIRIIAVLMMAILIWRHSRMQGRHGKWGRLPPSENSCGMLSDCPSGHYLTGNYTLTASKREAPTPLVQACSAEFGRWATVIYYAARDGAIVQSAYDPLPPTAPFEARGSGPA